MHKLLVGSMIASVVLANPVSAKARQGESPHPAHPVANATQGTVNATVVERDASGRATKVEVEGTIYPVCSPTVTDGCINPRTAGLNFGSVPLDYWPGEPASSAKSPQSDQ